MINFSTVIGTDAVVNASNKVRIGDVNVTVIEGQVAFTNVSDGRFKTNISENDVKGLDFISRLRPIVYNFDTRKFQEFLARNMPDSNRNRYFEDKDFSKSSSIRQSGFIAQEVEIAARESSYNFNGLHVPESDNDNYSLAYSQFVVPLVKSVQELSKQNEELKKEIDELRAMVVKTNGGNKTGTIKISEESSEAKLFQNAPNPFNQSTIIRYSIPADAKKAILTITNMEGVKMAEFDLVIQGRQNIEISGGKLSPGTYIYSLIVEEKLIDSKKMILTR